MVPPSADDSAENEAPIRLGDASEVLTVGVQHDLRARHQGAALIGYGSPNLLLGRSRSWQTQQNRRQGRDDPARSESQYGSR